MPVQFTPQAVARGRELVSEKCPAPAGWMRLGVRSGGCSGFSYFMDFVELPEPTDKQFEFDGLKVCVDRKSYLFLNGVEVDFEASLVKNGFVFNNPDAKRSCSCGESFSV
jgi:iron-sulfur cluster assembly protein